MLASTRTTHVRQFRSCQLAWWFTAVGKVPQAQKDHFDTGTLVHREMENWWRHGVVPLRPMALAAVWKVQEFLDQVNGERGRGKAEWSWEADVDGITYRGQADLVFWTDSGEWWLVDYKTSSDIDAYGLTEWQLRHDLQLGVYAHQVLSHLAPDAKFINVAHVQVATVDANGRRHSQPGFEPRVEIVMSLMSRDQCRAIWESAEQTVKEMAEVAGREPADIPGNRESCGAYGGCQYRTRCPAYAKWSREEQDMAYEPGKGIINPPPSYTVAAPAPAQSFMAPAPAPAPLWVLVDAAPELGQGLPEPVQHLDRVLAPLEAQVAAEARVPLYSMVEYGQGPARVVALLAKVPLSGTLLVDSMTPCANAAIEHLRQRATLVIRRSR
jgi:hypothetical protein